MKYIEVKKVQMLVAVLEIKKTLWILDFSLEIRENSYLILPRIPAVE